MYLIELGRHLRDLRKAAGLTQTQLAHLAGVARETVSRIENGSYNDLGIKKLNTLLELVGGEVAVRRRAKREVPDFVRRAVSTANVSHKGRLHGDEIIQALVTGTVPPGKSGQLYSMFADLSPANRDALIDQVAALADDRLKVRRAADRLQKRLAIAT